MANEGSTGRRWRIYRNTGTYGTPTWTVIAERKDLEIGLTKGKITSLRDSAEFMEYLKGYKDLTIGFPIKYTRANANHVALRTDFMADDDGYFDLLILDGTSATSGAQGIRAIVGLFDFSHSGPLEDETTVNLEFQPTYAEDGGSAIESDWHTVS